MNLDDISFGPFLLDVRHRQLRCGEVPVQVGRLEFDILCVLAKAKGGVVTKDEILAKVWPGRVVEDNAIQVHISALRKALDRSDDAQTYIVTVPGRGYRLVGIGPRIALHENDTEDTIGHAVPSASIAVLPFDNISGDSDQEYFADGMAEDIITALSRFRLFLVISRTSSFIYKGRKVDVRKIGRELGVRYVLKGSVRKEGNQLRVTAQLIETTNGSHLWAEKYDGAVEGVFDLQDQITAGVVIAIAPSIRRAEIERAQRKRPESLDAYDLYLRALPLAWAFSPEETAKAILLLDEALRLDPSYAAAHGLAAFCHLRGFVWIDLNETEKVMAIRHARAVLSMDTDDATALAFSAYVIALLVGDFDTACSAIDKALALNPNSAQTYFFGAAVNSFVGRFDTVINYARRSLQFSPFNPLRYIMLNALSRACFLTGRYEEAIEAALRATRVNPQFAPAYVWVVASHVRLGQMAQALEAKRQLLHVDPNFCFTRWASYIIAPPAHKEAIATALRDAGVPE